MSRSKLSIAAPLPSSITDWNKCLLQILGSTWLATSPPMKASDIMPDAPCQLRSKIEALKKIEPIKLPISKPVPDFVETITAYRAWAVRDSTLCALGGTTSWDKKKACVARCSDVRGCYIVPGLGCRCGFWGFKTLEDLIRSLETNYHLYDVSRYCVGTVSLWGRVIEHELGWRAEFAYPKELWLLDSNQAPIAAGYDVPVRML